MRMRVDLILLSESVMMCIACGDKSQRLPGVNFLLYCPSIYLLVQNPLAAVGLTHVLV